MIHAKGAGLSVLAVLGGAAAYLFGPWDALLAALLLAVCIDYATGVAVAVMQKNALERGWLEGAAQKSGHPADRQPCNAARPAARRLQRRGARGGLPVLYRKRGPVHSGKRGTSRPAAAEGAAGHARAAAAQGVTGR